MSDRLPPRVADRLSDATYDVFVSAVFGLEIAVKACIGTLPEMAEQIASFDTAVRLDGFIHLPLEHEVAVAGGSLSGDHRYPFDRVLAAQAIASDLTIVTRDPQMARFGCKVFW